MIFGPNAAIAIGTPCKVLRPIGEHDRVFFYKQDKINWVHFQP